MHCIRLDLKELLFSKVIWYWMSLLLQEGVRLAGPEAWVLSNIQKWIVGGVGCADKAGDFIGKGDPGGEQ